MVAASDHWEILNGWPWEAMEFLNFISTLNCYQFSWFSHLLCACRFQIILIIYAGRFYTGILHLLVTPAFIVSCYQTARLDYTFRWDSFIMLSRQMLNSLKECKSSPSYPFACCSQIFETRTTIGGIFLNKRLSKSESPGVSFKDPESHDSSRQASLGVCLSPRSDLCSMSPFKHLNNTLSLFHSITDFSLVHF